MIEDHLKNQLKALQEIMMNMDWKTLEMLLDELIDAVKKGNKIIATALGKNVPICEKFIGTLLSVGINGYFLHTNSAIHGDLGAVRENDVVLMLTKSGETEESIYLFHHLIKKKANIWILTFNNKGTLAKIADKKLILHLNHEGDKWNLVPNNSSIGFLFILQAMAMELIDRLEIDVRVFRDNHPGGYIGKILRGERT